MMDTQSTKNKPGVGGISPTGGQHYGGNTLNQAAESRKPSAILSMKPQARTLNSKPLFKRKLADKDLVMLYQAIETALPGRDCRIVQLMSCYGREGCTTIGMELSSVVAGILGRNVLFIDLEAASSPIGAVRQLSIASLMDVATGKTTISSAIAEYHADSMKFDYAYLTANNTQDNVLLHLERVQQTLVALSQQYELIVLHISNALSNSMGASLSRMSDGVVLVVEAGRTRAPAAKQLLQRISEKGVNVIGLVFNKRRYYIPRWLYRFV